MITSFEQLVLAASAGSPRTLVVAGASEIEVLLAVAEARDLGMVGGHLVGDEACIRRLASEAGLPLDGFELVHETDGAQIAARSARLAADVGADLIVKGTIGSAPYLRAILDKDLGFVKGRLLSHVGVIEAGDYGKLLLLTDGAMNIAPSLEQKVSICRNAVSVANALGVAPAAVAALAAVETVNAGMPATLDAACLAKMGERGQIPGAIIDGPLALDNAVSPKALAMKGIGSHLGGRADILLAPDIEAGNVIYKTLIYFCNAKAAGVVVGGSIPIVLNSRSDSHENRFLSLALGAYLSGKI